MSQRRKETLCGLLFIFLLSGCSTYQSKVAGARNALEAGQVDSAVEQFEKLAQKQDDDQLLYLLDYATALQIAGRYKESANVFIKADKLTEQMDYHSVSNIVGATLGGEEMIQYKGDSFEKFLINTLNSLNFVMMNDRDGALVEARRINEKISKMKMDGRKPYEQSPFARYLSATLWEADRKFDDAYIDYKNTYELDPLNPLLDEDLLRLSKLARRDDDYRKWKKKFPGAKENPAWSNSKYGQVVVLIQQGWGPVKRMSRDEYRVPTLYSQSSETNDVRVSIDDKDVGVTDVVYNVEKVAIETLAADSAALVARRMGALAAKAVMADQIRQKNEGLGAVAWLVMNLSDRADVRQWSTLPQTIQMKKLWLPVGKHKLRLQGIDRHGGPTADQFPEQEIEVKPRSTSFIHWRTLR